MTNLVEALTLGTVQGLGEFLPISSSAHLVIVPWLLNWKDPGLAFDVALHWGTLAAVLIYFRNDVRLLIRAFCRSLSPSTRNLRGDLHQRLAWLLALASVPGAVIGKLLEHEAETAFRNPLLIAATLGGFGIVLLIADRLGKKRKQLEGIVWTDALLIGLSQALAIVPGVSRSGSTIAAGLAVGLDREAAARFSFLMSMPIIFGAGLVHVGDMAANTNPAQFIVGFAAAAVFGLLSIRYLLKYISRHSFAVFVIYRLALAAAILAVYWLRLRP